jgi:hypothetical protein
MHHHIAAAALVLGMAFGPAAFAETQPLAREDNIWGGKAHQPIRSEVVRQERLEGFTLPPERERSENDRVETLYQSLLQGATRDRPASWALRRAGIYDTVRLSWFAARSNPVGVERDRHYVATEPQGFNR